MESVPTHTMISAQNGEIKAIHITDLENFLRTYGQLEDFVSGQMKCLICSDQISLDNAGSAKKVNGKIVLACNKMRCYDQIINGE